MYCGRNSAENGEDKRKDTVTHGICLKCFFLTRKEDVIDDLDWFKSELKKEMLNGKYKNPPDEKFRGQGFLSMKHEEKERIDKLLKDKKNLADYESIFNQIQSEINAEKHIGSKR